MSIEWREPPPSDTKQRGGSRWVNELAPLRERPTVWVMVRRFDKQQGALQAVTRLRKNDSFDGKWEFAARDGEVFARYIGPE